MFKYQYLESFISKHKHLPQQGSDAWKQLRKQFIGGSELSTILKQNKNKSISKLITEKLGFNCFEGNAITYWGNIFEELIRLHCEETFSCTIRETGSIPYEHGCLSYSPDGLAVVPTHKLSEVFGNLPSNIDHTSPTQLVLFEFKCPHSRIPSFDIPEYYLPQVSVGMNIIDIMETAAFVQAVYRRCPFEALKYNSEHTHHGHFKRADTTNNPIECGFMIIYTDDEHAEYVDGLKETFANDSSSSFIKVGDKFVVDLGNYIDTELFEEVLANCVNKSLKIDYSFRHKYDSKIFDEDSYKQDMYDNSLQYQSMKHLCKKISKLPHVVGVLPFKLLSVFMTSVEKNPNYIQEVNAHNKAKTVLQCIDEHSHINDKAEAVKSIRKWKL